MRLRVHRWTRVQAELPQTSEGASLYARIEQEISGKLYTKKTVITLPPDQNQMVVDALNVIKAKEQRELEIGSRA